MMATRAFLSYEIGVTHCIPQALAASNKRLYNELHSVWKRHAKLAIRTSTNISLEQISLWSDWERVVHITSINIELRRGFQSHLSSGHCTYYDAPWRVHRDIRAAAIVLSRFIGLRTFRLTIHSMVSYKELRSVVTAVASSTLLRDLPRDRWYNKSRIEAKTRLLLGDDNGAVDGTVLLSGLPDILST